MEMWRYITVEEAAHRLGVDVHLFHRMVKAGIYRAETVNGAPHVFSSDIEAAIARIERRLRGSNGTVAGSPS